MGYLILIPLLIVLFIFSIAIRGLSLFSKLKKDPKKIEMILLTVMLIFAFTTGIIGFESSEAYENLTQEDVLFNIITMFALNYSDPVGNSVLLNISRYCAAMFTFGTLFLLLNQLFDYLYSLIIGLSEKSAFIVGDSSYADQLVESMRPYGIRGKDKYISGKGPVFLLGDDAENYKFYSENVERLRDKRVYIQSRNSPGLFVPYPKKDEKEKVFIKMFSFEELAAHIYWKKYPMVESPLTIDEAKKILDTKYHLRIAIIGDGPLVEELLLFGTQYNVINEESTVEFHVFEGNEEFADVHRNLDKLNVFVHEEKWYSYSELNMMDRIIVADQENQNKIIHELYMINPQFKIHVFSPHNSNIDEMLMLSRIDDRGGKIDGDDALVVFPWISEVFKKEVITSENRIKAAKTLNYFYSHSDEITSFMDIDESDIDEEWNQESMDSYKRYSNLFSTDNAEKYTAVCEELFADEKYAEKMRRLEHIRWDSYHYFFNWRVGNDEEKAVIEAKGKNKDVSKRIHMDLIPFDELSAAEQKKDDVIKWLILYKKFLEERDRSRK